MKVQATALLFFFSGSSATDSVSRLRVRGGVSNGRHAISHADLVIPQEIMQRALKRIEEEEEKMAKGIPVEIPGEKDDDDAMSMSMSMSMTVKIGGGVGRFEPEEDDSFSLSMSLALEATSEAVMADADVVVASEADGESIEGRKKAAKKSKKAKQPKQPKKPKKPKMEKIGKQDPVRRRART